MMLIEAHGHLIIIFIGIPLIYLLVNYLRKIRIQYLILMGLDKMKADTDALIQIQTLQGMIAEARVSQTENASLIGYVNLHVVECQSMDCPCKSDSDLYDAQSGKFSQRNVGYHKDLIFLNHLNKRLYEDALNKFINSPRLHIAFSFFLFDCMKNVHGSLIELDIASKKKPSLQQQFTIFRNKDTIENYIKGESNQAKDIYNQLTNVIEFERLFVECQRAIERVCSHQIEFWTQLNGTMPDMNLLHDFATKIYDGTREAEDYWAKLCKINANYPKALTVYGNYMSQVKNNDQLGYELLDKAKANANKKSLDELIKSSDILFADDTVVIHLSGNKDTAGRIVKTNEGLSKIFGYNKSEVMGHSINILMPSIFAKRHNEFLEKFFKTGRKTMFNQEKYLYALHRSGCCFQIKILLKQMPSLAEGIQYVAMIRQSQSDYDYIITDTRGVIDCFSQGVGSRLKLPSNLFKDSEINIQILAPELIKIFSSADKKRTLFDKFREAGGQKLMFMVPKDFAQNTQGDSKKMSKDPTKAGIAKLKEHRNKKKMGEILYRELNKDMNKHGGIANKSITPQKLLQSPEYRDCENKEPARCEIQDLTFGDIYKNFQPLKLRVFKLSWSSAKAARNQDQLSEAGELVPPSHSGASFDWRDKNDGGISSRGNPERSYEEQKGIYDFVEKGGPSYDHSHVMNVFRNKNEDNKSDHQSSINTGTNKSKDNQSSSKNQNVNAGEREDTKMTDKIPGNQMTTESRVDTFENKPNPSKAKGSAEESKKDMDSMGWPPKVSPKDDEKSKGAPLSTNETKNAAVPTTLGEKPKDESARESDSKNSSGRFPRPTGIVQQDSILASVEPERRRSILNPGDAKQNDSKKSKSNKSVGGDKSAESGHGESSSGKPAEYEINPFGYVGAESDNLSRIEEQKDEVDDNLSKPRSITPKHNVRVPSVLDETVEILHKNPNEHLKNIESHSQKPVGNVFIDGNKDHTSEFDDEHKINQDDTRSLPPIKPKRIRRESKDEMDSYYTKQEYEGLSMPSDKDRRSGEIIKKPSRSEEKKILLHEKRSMKQAKKKIHSKIITHPKYEEAQEELQDLMEYHQGEEEQKLRRALLAHENKKKRKEKKKAGKGKKRKKPEKSEEDEGSESPESKRPDDEDKNEDAKKDEENLENSEDEDEDGDEEPDNAETQSSVTSGSTGSTIRSFYSLRAAIDEKFVPGSIKNLRCTANIVFFVLLCLAIVYFVMQVILFGKISQSLKNIRHSGDRLNYLIDVNLHATTMSIITADYKLRKNYPNLNPYSYVLYDNQTIKEQLFEDTRELLRTAATKLKNVETDLSLETASLSRESLNKINPEGVMLDFRPVEGMPKGYDYTIWQAMMEIVVSSFRIATMDIDQVDDTTDSTVYFVTHNSPNGILISLQSSTAAIIDESENSRKSNVFIFLILLCVVSFALVVSTILLIPVIRNVKMNKQDVLELFMLVKKPDIEEELTKCKKFYSTIQTGQETELNVAGPEENKENQNAQNNDAETLEQKNKKILDRMGKSATRKQKKFKRLSVGLGMVAFKFSFIILIMEGYFLMTYFLSETFLNRVSSLTTEISQLVSRLPTHGLFLLIVKYFGVNKIKKIEMQFLEIIICKLGKLLLKNILKQFKVCFILKKIVYLMYFYTENIISM